MIDERIKKSILNKLQGYVMESDIQDDEYAELEYDNVISEDELEDFYYQGLNQCCNYCYFLEYPKEEIDGQKVMNKRFETGLILWTAGLIWRKYNIRINDNMEESGNVASYGDQLIIDAKEILKPFIYTIVHFW